MFASAHEVLSDKGVDMPVVMQDSLVQTVQRPVAAPQVGQVVDVPVVVQRQVLGFRGAAVLLFGYGRRCEHAATRCLATVKCLRLSSSPEFVDIPLRNRDRYAQLQLCMGGLVWPAWWPR